MGRCRRLLDTETERMKAHCQTPEEFALIVFAERTGYRSSELASLKVKDVWDGTKLKTHVQVAASHMKREVIRMSIPLHKELKTALLRWLMQLKESGFLKPDTPLWLSRKCKTVLHGWNRTTIWTVIKRVALRAGIEGHIGVHSYRKTFGVRIWEKSGKDILKVKRALGHVEVSSTQVYIQDAVDDPEVEALILAA
jgi:integrase